MTQTPNQELSGKHMDVNSFINHYIEEVSSGIVAESGRPGDRFHLGKLILQGLKNAPPEFLLQIDGGTGMSETAGSVLERSVRCATCFKTLGLGCGDVIATMAPNNLDVCIPFYAAMFSGITVSPTEWNFGVQDCAKLLNIIRPKLIFCAHERAQVIQESIDLIQLDAILITFGESDGYDSFNTFLEKYGRPLAVDEFKPTGLDTEKEAALFVWTSGTTGLTKATILTHKNLAISAPYWICMFDTYPNPTRMAMVASPLQWISVIGMFVLSPIVHFTRLQTSKTPTPEHALQMIRKYKPTFIVISPHFLTSLMKSAEHKAGDLECFEVIVIGGSAVTDDVVKNFKALSPKTQLHQSFGMSEIGVALTYDGSQLKGAMKPVGLVKCRLVEPSTGLDIDKPNVHGELWMSGPTLFKGYYQNPQDTKETISVDGWLKSGDIFYKDVNGRYFFVERAKFLLKYRSHHVSPVEIEPVIREHPSVMEAAVTGIFSEDCGELIVACVVRRPNCDVTAQEIKDLVKDSLADHKHLRGGVIFLKTLPMTPTCKIDRKKLRQLVLQHERL